MREPIRTLPPLSTYATILKAPQLRTSQVYFTGADKLYEELKRALRAEVDEVAWLALYSTVSRPFDPLETGKIAVKVINHYGDEVFHVYEV